MTSTSEARKRREESLSEVSRCGLSHDIPFVYGRSVGEIFIEFAEFCPGCGEKL